MLLNGCGLLPPAGTAPAWQERVAPAYNLGQQQLCLRIPWNHNSDLSSYSFLFLKGLCPGTLLLFSLYFAYKGLLKSWISCVPPPQILCSLTWKNHCPRSIRWGREYVWWGGGASYFPTWRECGTNCVHSMLLTCE